MLYSAPHMFGAKASKDDKEKNKEFEPVEPVEVNAEVLPSDLQDEQADEYIEVIYDDNEVSEAEKAEGLSEVSEAEEASEASEPYEVDEANEEDTLDEVNLINEGKTVIQESQDEAGLSRIDPFKALEKMYGIYEKLEK
jgi:hypothetical protein